MAQDYLSIGELSAQGKEMLRENFFDAIALDLQGTHFYKLVWLERDLLNATARVQITFAKVSRLDHEWAGVVEDALERLYSRHEKFREFLHAWEGFARTESKRLLRLAQDFITSCIENEPTLGRLRELKAEVSHELPRHDKPARRFGKALEGLFNQDQRLREAMEAYFPLFPLLEDALRLFEGDLIRLRFISSGARKPPPGERLDLLLSEKVLHVVELPGDCFLNPAPDRPLIKWDFSSKEKTAETFLRVAGKESKHIELLAKKDLKKHELAKRLFSSISDPHLVKTYRDAHLCLYLEKEGADPAPYPGIPLRPEQFWSMAMNLDLIHETEDFLMLKVVAHRNPILITYLNTPRRNRGSFFAFINPVL